LDAVINAYVICAAFRDKLAQKKPVAEISFENRLMQSAMTPWQLLVKMAKF